MKRIQNKKVGSACGCAFAFGLAAALAICACEPQAGTGDSSRDSTEDDGKADDLDAASDGDSSADTEPALPAVPSGLGVSPSVTAYRKWYPIGDGATPAVDALEVEVTLEDADFVDSWIDGQFAGRFSGNAGAFKIDPPIAGSAAGEHELILSADGASEAFSRIPFTRTQPFYVFVTNDWDTADNPEASLERQERLHTRHPKLKITHFVGPYTFTDPAVTSARAQQLVTWVNDLVATYGDEVGLHIHPYCNFVETAELICRSTPSFAKAWDSTGYTVFLSAYTEAETFSMLERALDVFEQNGLGVPVSFRAGGWTVALHNLAALADAGFVADSSANNWARLEEWKYQPNASLYSWNKNQWQTIGDTSQPYYPNEADILNAAAPQIGILEVPDNGSLCDYVTSAEIVDIFKKNWPGGGLDEPKSFVMGYHPPNFSESFFNRVDEALTHIDQFLLADDAGPVVYEVLRTSAQVWPKP